MECPPIGTPSRPLPSDRCCTAGRPENSPADWNYFRQKKKREKKGAQRVPLLNHHLTSRVPRPKVDRAGRECCCWAPFMQKFFLSLPCWYEPKFRIDGPAHDEKPRQDVDKDPADPGRHGVRLRRAEVNVEHHHSHANAARYIINTQKE